MQNYAPIDLYCEIRRHARLSKGLLLETAKKAIRTDLINNGFVDTENGIRIKINHTEGRLGGLQAWLVCPLCNHQYRKLYLKESSLACRRCHKIPYILRNLSKSSTGKMGRALHFLNRAENLLGSTLRLGVAKKKKLEKYCCMVSNVLESHHASIMGLK